MRPHLTRRHLSPRPPTSRALSRRQLGGLIAGGLLASAVPPVVAATGRRRSPFTGLVPDLNRLAPGSTQVLLVATDTYGATRAQVSGWRLGADRRWTQVLGPFDTAWIGTKGFAAPSAKREGDLRSPTGVFPFVTAFGVSRPTGLRLPWMPVHYPHDYWVDDVRSTRYNTHVVVAGKTKAARAPVGRSNPLPTYPYAAVLGYNTTRRVRGAGSAIFLHPTHDSATLGCVALPLPELAQVLRWLDPAQQPRIVMGVGAALLAMAGGPLTVAQPPVQPPAPPAPPQPAPPTDPPSPVPAPTDPEEPTPTPSASSTPAPSSSAPVIGLPGFP